VEGSWPGTFDVMSRRAGKVTMRAGVRETGLDPPLSHRYTRIAENGVAEFTLGLPKARQIGPNRTER